jgi:hypothetical protein
MYKRRPAGSLRAGATTGDAERGHTPRAWSTRRENQKEVLSGATHNASQRNQRRTDQHHRDFVAEPRNGELHLLYRNRRLGGPSGR